MVTPLFPRKPFTNPEIPLLGGYADSLEFGVVRRCWFPARRLNHKVEPNAPLNGVRPGTPSIANQNQDMNDAAFT